MVSFPTSMSVTDARAAFAGLAPVGIDELDGFWQGGAIDTGHPLDRLLVVSGWEGKRFSGDDADPLVMRGAFGRYRLNPGLAPMGLAMALGLGNWPLAGAAFRLLGPLAATRRPRARLRMIALGGVVSAAMVYDQLPIIDHFRRWDGRRLMGMMDRRGDGRPCFFTLAKAD